MTVKKKRKTNTFSSQKPNHNISKILSKGKGKKRKVNMKDAAKAPSKGTTGVGFNVIPSRSMNSGSSYNAGSGI